MAVYSETDDGEEMLDCGESYDSKIYGHCPCCGSSLTTCLTDAQVIDTEVNQQLYMQHDKCDICEHEWVDKWWEVWTPNGIKIVPADSNGNADHKRLDTDNNHYH